MDEKQYVDHLRETYQGEVFGEEFYGTAARLCGDSSRRRRWAALAALEKQTKERVAAALAARGESVRAGAVVRGLGRAFGVVAVVIPERVAVRVVGVVVRRALVGFERLAREGARWEGDRGLLEELVAHEVAQVEFFAREARGEGARAVEAVEGMLRGAG